MIKFFYLSLGILKREGSKDYCDSPRSILKGSSGGLSSPDPASTGPHVPEDNSLKSILKGNDSSPNSPQEDEDTEVVRVVSPSPPHLKGVLKKDSSQDKEIRSILKPQSEFVRHLSDSSSGETPN